MRVTGGSERGRKVRRGKGCGVRPTSEKVRSAIFSMIGGKAVVGVRVLDIYAGTGALGIEALSRGASWAEFVEINARFCQGIRVTLREMGFSEVGRVHCARAERKLNTLSGEYGLVLIDPPYDLDPWPRLMRDLGSGRILSDGALIVAEHHQKGRLDDSYGRLEKITVRRHGDTTVSIFRFGVADG